MTGSLSGIVNGIGAFAGVAAPIVTGIVVKNLGGFEIALALGGCMVLLSAFIISFIVPELKPIELDVKSEI